MEYSTRSQIVVVFVDLAKSIADFQVIFIIIHPMLFAAIDRDTAIWALEVHMRGSHIPFSDGSSITNCGRIEWDSRMLVIGVRAVCILSHVGSSATEFGNWRLGKRVEEIIWVQTK